MKRIFSVFMGVILSMKMIPTNSINTFAENNSPQKLIFTVESSEVTMSEGETHQLDVMIDSQYSDDASVYFFSTKHKTIVSHDGVVTAYSCGEDHILIEVSYPDDKSDTGRSVQSQSVKIHVQPNEKIPTEIRSELDRLQAQSPFGDYQRKTLELLGFLKQNAPRITAEQVDEILHNDLLAEEKIAEINVLHGYPDYIWRGDPGSLEYWLDEKGTDKILIVGKAMFWRIKVINDGTVMEATPLYPPEIGSETIIGPLDYSDDTYLTFNQFPRELSGALTGDANGDGIFNIADAVSLKKYLMSDSDTALDKWDNADFNQDGMLNAVDFTLMKRELFS